ncbi:phiSA1p31-related protein [Streptomyces sp. NPDC086782]|uniref:phiSA1p31-related protein n=1 Tax=Streptomyces sp. NPDC086782 TaxID=3365757 RepID=UPI00380449B2
MAAQTFKAGDKVAHRSWGAGEIVFGPFLRDGSEDNYLMKALSNGEHRLVDSPAMTIASKFNVGDKVRGVYSDDIYTIEAGPFRSAYGEWYATKDEDGDVGHNDADSLKAVETTEDASLKEGDVVRTLHDNAFHADVKAGDLFEVRAFAPYFPDRIKVDAGPGARMAQWTFRPQDFEKVGADKAAVHDGVVYDLTARYRDKDGDVWRFERCPDGEVHGAWTSRAIDEYDETLAETVRDYGPLTRV